MKMVVAEQAVRRNLSKKELRRSAKQKKKTEKN